MVYGKLFAQMYDGTLGTKGPWQALVTFQQLIILADKHGAVDMTAEAIARRTTVPLDIIATGIAELEQPDPDSRSPEEEGRRIVRIDPDRCWGWRIVNYGHYRKIRTEEERREYHREYQRKRRANSKTDNEVTPCQHVNTASSDSTNSSKQEAGSRSSPIGEDAASTSSTPSTEFGLVNRQLGERLLARFSERDQASIAASLASADDADRLARWLLGALDGLGTDGGIPVAPDVLASALRDMDLAGVNLTGNAIRGWVRNLKTSNGRPDESPGEAALRMMRERDP